MARKLNLKHPCERVILDLESKRIRGFDFRCGEHYNPIIIRVEQKQVARLTIVLVTNMAHSL